MKTTYNGKEVEIIEEIEEDGLEYYRIRIGQVEIVVQKKYVEVEDA